MLQEHAGVRFPKAASSCAGERKPNAKEGKGSGWQVDRQQNKPATKEYRGKFKYFLMCSSFFGAARDLGWKALHCSHMQAALWRAICSLQPFLKRCLWFPGFFLHCDQVR